MTNVMDWVGKQEVVTEVLDPQRALKFATTLNKPLNCTTGHALPDLWHWIVCVTAIPMDQIGRDGHAKKGLFYPPVDLPRRMWAGGRFSFDQALTLGETITRTSTIKDIKFKTGRSGELAFVTVSHAYSGDQGGSITEEHDIVYREDPSTDSVPIEAAPVVDETPSDWQQSYMAHPVQLMRYSALTFNGHRIHYDRDYAAFEGYDGLVVHGPLIATYMLDLVRQHLPEARVKTFSFRALRPIIDINAFSVHASQTGEGVQLWAKDHLGQRAMQGEAQFYV